jgi:hypothetical protein
MAKGIDPKMDKWISRLADKVFRHAEKCMEEAGLENVSDYDYQVDQIAETLAEDVLREVRTRIRGQGKADEPPGPAQADAQSPGPFPPGDPYPTVAREQWDQMINPANRLFAPLPKMDVAVIITPLHLFVAAAVAGGQPASDALSTGLMAERQVERILEGRAGTKESPSNSSG